MPRGTSCLDEAIRQGRLWTPAHLTTKPVAWYDASDFATITAASNLVSQWSDKSGNARHVTSSGSNRPTLTLAASASAINARQVLSFDNTDDFLDVSLTGFPNNTTGISCFGVHRHNGAGSDEAFWDISESAITTNETGSMFNESGVLYVRSGGVGNDASVTIGGGLRQTYSLHSTAKRELWINGTFQTSNTTPTTAKNANNLRIGGLHSLYFFDGQIGELIYLSGEPSTRDRQRIEGYQHHRWGLTANLPASHPYRTAPPLIGT